MQTVIGYVRVSTTEQASSGLGLAAQRHTIEAEAERRGWRLVAIYEDAGASGRSLSGRLGLAAALDRLENGDAEALIVAKVDRLSRSIKDLVGLLERAGRKRWALVALDVGVDMTTPAGEAMAHMMATFAQFERRLIGERTREALAQARERGVVLGRPRSQPDVVVHRVMTERAAGGTLRAIAAGLNADSVPTAQSGAAWHASTVRALLVTYAASPEEPSL